MIVAETGSGYRFVTQPAHAALAGRFADRWGNDAFERPEPLPAVAMAAHRHDDGWWSYDRRPHLDGDGAPVDFTELPAATWTTLYDRGIDGVVDLDRYAGLLVSMHGAGLRRRRYGLSPDWPPTPAAFAGFVERQEALQDRLAHESLADEHDRRVTGADLAALSDLHEEGGPPADAGSLLWRNYIRLQAWDALSLAFAATASPPGYDEVGPVPTGPGGSDETLTVDPLGDGAFRVAPYPFDEDPLEASMPARTVDEDAFEDEAGLVRAYYRAPREHVAFTLRS